MEDGRHSLTGSLWEAGSVIGSNETEAEQEQRSARVEEKYSSDGLPLGPAYKTAYSQ